VSDLDKGPAATVVAAHRPIDYITNLPCLFLRREATVASQGESDADVSLVHSTGVEFGEQRREQARSWAGTGDVAHDHSDAMTGTYQLTETVQAAGRLEGA
jgi:hypothetical protein